MPALVCTTVPPAKSSAPKPQIRPAPAAISSAGLVAAASGPGHHQTMWAMGK